MGGAIEEVRRQRVAARLDVTFPQTEMLRKVREMQAQRPGEHLFRVMAPSERGHAGIKDDAVNYAEVVLSANNRGGVVEMSLQIVDADAKPEGRGEAVLRAAANSPGGVVNVA